MAAQKPNLRLVAAEGEEVMADREEIASEKKHPRTGGGEEVDEDGAQGRIPARRWVMHGAVMFGREFCYAMETALVTPVLLQIGLPEQYYSLTWFLSPLLGLLFTPVIGSASDRCTLAWGKRRPFILVLCVGVLLGVAMFLNGSLIGLAMGDTPGSQPIGIVFTVLGVVVLDFCADASEGPIRAYLLDVADTDEQDMALNIHAFSAGLGGAVGYMLGGLDWTDTPLGHVFKSQEQVLFVFAAVIFIFSVALHMFSIPEQTFSRRHTTKAAADDPSSSEHSIASPSVDMIVEEDSFVQASSRLDNKLDNPEVELLDHLSVDCMRSKSDSVLALPDTNIQLDPDLDLQSLNFPPEGEPFLPDTQEVWEDVFLPSNRNSPGSPTAATLLSPPSHCSMLPSTGGMVELQPDGWTQLKEQTNDPASPPLNNQHVKAVNGSKLGVCSSGPSHSIKHSTSNKLATKSCNSNSPRPLFNRQPSFTFSYYLRVGSQRYRNKRLSTRTIQPITNSYSLIDLSGLQRGAERRELQLSVGNLSYDGSISEGETAGGTTVRLLWLSMLKMPRQLWRLCVCHLLTWFSIIAEAVFYTDFMGQVIYHGHPKAPVNSTKLHNYHKGVQMGCWGLVVYAATAAVCSALLQKYLDNFDLSIKIVYIMGTLGFSIGTAVMAIFPNVYVAMVMISGMGVISMSISYCPYALLGQYHEIKEYIHHSPANSRRGFGIDCAILSCQVYISQILVASALGAVVEAVGSVRVIPMVASGGSFLGFLTACFLVVYPEEEAGSSEQERRTEALPVVGGPSGERSNHEPGKLKST